MFTMRGDLMKRLHFPRWREVLSADSSVSVDRRASIEITIRWYLGWCRRNRAVCTITSARRFMDEVAREKSPSEAVLQQWREALNWFFGRGSQTGVPSREHGNGHLQEDSVSSEPPRDWEDAMRALIRRRDGKKNKVSFYLTGRPSARGRCVCVSRIGFVGAGCFRVTVGHGRACPGRCLPMGRVGSTVSPVCPDLLPRGCGTR